MRPSSFGTLNLKKNFRTPRIKTPVFTRSFEFKPFRSFSGYHPKHDYEEHFGPVPFNQYERIQYFKKVLEHQKTVPKDKRFKISEEELQTHIDQIHEAFLISIQGSGALALYHRTIEALKEMGYDTKEKREKFYHEVIISPGYTTLEFTFPGKLPHHTYEEMPIIKYEGEPSEHEH